MGSEEKRALENHIAKAEDLDNFLEHISWTDVVYPALQRQRSTFVRMLTDTVLGRPTTVPTPGANEGRTLKPEEIAGRIEGIDWVVGFLNKTLERGSEAYDKLKSQGDVVSY